MSKIFIILFLIIFRNNLYAHGLSEEMEYFVLGMLLSFSVIGLNILFNITKHILSANNKFKIGIVSFLLQSLINSIIITLSFLVLYFYSLFENSNTNGIFLYFVPIFIIVSHILINNKITNKIISKIDKKKAP